MGLLIYAIVKEKVWLVTLTSAEMFSENTSAFCCANLTQVKSLECMLGFFLKTFTKLAQFG